MEGTCRAGACPMGTSLLCRKGGLESWFTPCTERYLQVRKVRKSCSKEIQENIDIILVFLSKQNLEAIKKKRFLNFTTSTLELRKTNDIKHEVNGNLTDWKKIFVQRTDGS